MIDEESPDKISKEIFKSWTDKKIIEYWGYCKNMPEVLTKVLW